MPVLSKAQKDLRSILLYAQELVGMNEKVILDLASEPHPAFHEEKVHGLEGIELAVGGGAPWLRLRRLRETRPPEPDAMFEGWVKDGPHPSPDRAPALLDQRMLRLPIEEISDLAEAGLVAAADVMRPRGADEERPAEMDVILRTAAMPEFREAWRAYVEGPWAAWAEAERPRRRSIAVYNALYQVQQRVLTSGEDSAVELVWGIGVARWQHERGKVNVPLVEQSVEIDLEEDGTLAVAPRQVPPHVVLRAFHELEVEGAKALQRDAAEGLERRADDPDIAFSPFEPKAWEPVLRSCAARLSSSAVYVPDEEGRDPADRSLPPLDGTLRITDTWVLYVRRRSEDFRKEDIQRLVRQVEEAAGEEALPPAGRRFVNPPSDGRLYPDGDADDILRASTWTVPEVGPGGWGGPGSGSGGSGPGGERREGIDYFLPLPHNDEQVEIIRRLEESDGVVVQGPPGTGKTHTIANVICHYLATKRRVLVTARTAEALTALQDKLPEGIRDLAIAVIHNDREGARQLEQAVQVLANEAKQISPRQVKQDILDRQAVLAANRDRIAAIDRALVDIARRNLAEFERDGRKVLVMDLARRVAEDRAAHAWFDDAIDMGPGFDPRFGDAEIVEARALRRALGPDIACPADLLPAPADLPDAARLLAAHAALAAAGAAEARTRGGGVPVMVSGRDALAAEVRDWLRGLADFAAEADAWVLDAYRVLVGVRRMDEVAATGLRRSLERWAALHAVGQALAMRAVDAGDASPADEAFDAAVAALARGERPFGLLSFGKSAARERIGRVTVDGAAPVGTEGWRLVREHRAWQRDLVAFLRAWSAVGASLGMPALPTEWDAGRLALTRLGRSVTAALRLADRAGEMAAVLGGLFPAGLDAREAVCGADPARALEALEVNLGRTGARDAAEARDRLLVLSEGLAHPFHDALRDVADALGRPETPPDGLAETWRDVLAEAARLHALRPARARLDAVAASVRASGAPGWAGRLAERPSPGEADLFAPVGWRETWEWARADGFLRSLEGRDAIRILGEERAELERVQRQALTEVVRLRTFLGLKSNLTERIESALASFSAAIAKLGAGTGKSAGRHRRVIRDATLDAAAAVPCWILPEWRVSEQLPAELNAFDLVIIDEASQSDITALPAILRGKKLLIVGDDKQVSPTPVGMDERTVVQLRTTFLTGLPYADQMDPSTSLYDLGAILFPGKAIMLREHFRCVEPIIRFSSRFYPKALVPMRLPKASERLDPPLVDILVRDGEKRGDVNRREAEVMVAEIRQLSEDPAFAGRTFGVISLIGDKQAKLIQDRLMQELGAEVMERHRMVCGSAAALQGQERDVVFLSMVACPRTATAQRQRMFEQRFNVALSRARDRMVLVRSVTSSDLKPGDLKLKVIEHFRNPMGDGKVVGRREVLDLCESGFEREFGARLLDMGYRLRPQVQVGGFRMDFVVEGADDRRLAVELDGDKYHGPDRWAADFGL